MKSAIWKRQVWPFQWTMEPPSPVPGRNPLIRRSGSAIWSTLARTVIVSRLASIISDLRIAKRNSSCMAGDWKSGTVSRPAPRSSPTTLRPAAGNSFARMEPVMPTPIVTASTGRNRSAMPRLRSGKLRRNVGIDMDVAHSVLRQAHGRAIDDNAVLVDHVIVGREGAGEADHAPGDHVAIATIDRIPEEALDRGFPEMR